MKSVYEDLSLTNVGKAIQDIYEYLTENGSLKVIR